MSDDYAILERDARGRIVRRAGAVPGAGRPGGDDLHRLRRALLESCDDETMTQFVNALRKKLQKGSLEAAQFVFDRLLGKPGVTVSHDVDGNLAGFMAAWASLRAAEGDEQE